MKTIKLGIFGLGRGGDFFVIKEFFGCICETDLI